MDRDAGRGGTLSILDYRHPLFEPFSGSRGADFSAARFFRYRRWVTEAARLLAQSGAAIVAITDSPLSPLVELTDTWCEIEVPASGPFDSSVPAVAIAELLVARVARDLQHEATARIDRIETLWEQTGVFQQ